MYMNSVISNPLTLFTSLLQELVKCIKGGHTTDVVFLINNGADPSRCSTNNSATTRTYQQTKYSN